eukprot:CAMPEP_0197678706 /NCGR_PEP_ID=MMETSP1338-20131121/90495_1 /TAXON_ID=43686 ORGANISM="Pelagodinium beii, Strain RCC1491" /NCGR_SAMPLE_ID=MMETSP1338 /ASSEMBLY_ACC=CAM_ASM_000754 /LENGTH=153 /DNA_ID=CAMNT_0043259671 /DNA_START=247 /DNA_END=706 /DNA_ORIENTATION=-
MLLAGEVEELDGQALSTAVAGWVGMLPDDILQDRGPVDERLLQKSLPGCHQHHLWVFLAQTAKRRGARRQHQPEIQQVWMGLTGFLMSQQLHVKPAKKSKRALWAASSLPLARVSQTLQTVFSHGETMESLALGSHGGQAVTLSARWAKNWDQ